MSLDQMSIKSHHENTGILQQRQIGLTEHIKHGIISYLEMEQEYFGRILEVYTNTFSFKERFFQVVFEGLFFGGVDFNHAIFKDCIFKDCVFSKCNVSDVRLYGDSSFVNCLFDRMRLGNDTSLGEHSGDYIDCVFRNCAFRNKAMSIGDPPYTQYTRCVFENCAMKNVSFNKSSFVKSSFIGKLSDVTFNGVFQSCSSQDLHLEIDFSDSIWGEYVGFHRCSFSDLSQCTPPKGKTFEELLHYICDDGIMRLNTLE